jgi:hypothetical protein
VVEISSNNSHLFISAHDVESPESLLIELPEKRAQEILREFQNDYERIASSLQVMNKRLVLLNPVSFLNLIFFRDMILSRIFSMIVYSNLNSSVEIYLEKAASR